MIRASGLCFLVPVGTALRSLRLHTDEARMTRAFTCAEATTSPKGSLPTCATGEPHFPRVDSGKSEVRSRNPVKSVLLAL